jgi:hypothetical protein
MSVLPVGCPESGGKLRNSEKMRKIQKFKKIPKIEKNSQNLAKTHKNLCLVSHFGE